MEKTEYKNILEVNYRFSIAYTLAFGMPTSKNKIRKYLTESGRHTTIVDNHKEHFRFTKRKDDRQGLLIKSKPDLLIELIDSKIKLDTKSKMYIKQLLTNKIIEKAISQNVKDSIKSGHKRIDHNFLLKNIVTLFIGEYIVSEYRKYFKPKIDQNEYLKNSKYLNEHFLPELSYRKKYSKHNRHTKQLKNILNDFNRDILLKIICLYPDYKLLLRLPKAGIVIAEASK
jgi:hypothetical protein